MKNRKFYLNFIIAKIFASFLFASSIGAQTPLVKITQTLMLGETEIRINIYEKKGANLTFFSPHHNEQAGLIVAKQVIGKRGGRLIEIEARDERGNPARQLKFAFLGKSYSVDPNRIFTENGLRCSGVSSEVGTVIKKFATDLLKTILAPGGNKLREGEKFLVAMHNNSDVDRVRNPTGRVQDLTAYAFFKYGRLFGSSANNFQEQADGVYLSNVEADEDNFFFLSSPTFLSFFAEKGFNVVVQKPTVKLRSASCNVDDGSLSVFAARQNLPYINIEADAVSGSVRQLQMLESVYELLQKMSESKSKSAVASEKSDKAGEIE